jgi:hypothetical protein
LFAESRTLLTSELLYVCGGGRETESKLPLLQPKVRSASNFP